MLFESNKLKRNPSQSRSRLMVESILDATEILLLSGNPHKITTISIAEKAGISVGSLYQYFSDKNLIIDAIIDMKFSSIENELFGNFDSKIIADIDKSTFLLVEKLYSILSSNVLLLSDEEFLPPDHRHLINDKRVQLSEKIVAHLTNGAKIKNISLASYTLDKLLFGNIEKYIFQKNKIFEDSKFIRELTNFVIVYINYLCDEATQ